MRTHARARVSPSQVMLFLGAWAALAGCGGVSAAERLTRTDGAAADVAVAAIETDRVVLTNAAEAAVALGDVWRIERAPAPLSVSGLVERVILDRGEISVRRLTVLGAICRFDWAGGENAAIAQGAVRALFLDAGAGQAIKDAAARALEKATAADQVVAMGPDNVVLTLDGGVRTVGTNAIVVQYQGKDRTLGRAKVGAVVFGRTGTVERAAGELPWKVTMADGAWVEGREARMAAGVLTVALREGTLDMPWSAVSRLEHRGPNVRFLSRMDPVRVSGGAVIGLELPWQRDRSAMNRPLQLRGQVHDTGLGTHAPSELVFELPEGAQRFMAVVGLDEEFGRKGDCVVVVRVDDREALRRRMRGTDASLPVELAVRDGRRLTLTVEPGENYDLGDHVNWYDARLLLAP